MIPVVLQPEWADFDTKVRQPGLAWLAGKGIALNGPLPAKTKIPDYWSRSNKALWDAYGGVCGYLAIYFEWATGASSTDHFVAKSKDAGQAYEWANYRLSCLGANRNKNKFDDVLDPVSLAADTFELNLVSGEIAPGRGLNTATAAMAHKTIQRLKLDSPELNKMRQKHFSRYVRNRDEQDLREQSPFVWYEAQRQRLL